MTTFRDGTRRHVTQGPLEWSVQTVGEGSGRPSLLLVHGAGSSSHSFSALAPHLASRFTLVAPDLPGHARTRARSGFDPTLPNTARAVGALLRTLDLRPVAAIGHSAGAAVLVQMVLEGWLAPRVLIGLAAALAPLRGASRIVLPRAASALARGRGGRLVASALGRRLEVERVLGQTGSTLEPSRLTAYRELARCPTHVAGVLRMLSRWDPAPVYAALPRIRVPTWLLAGEHDLAVTLTSQRAAWARLWRGELVVVRGAGHLLHEERPAAVARELARALDPASVSA